MIPQARLLLIALSAAVILLQSDVDAFTIVSRQTCRKTTTSFRSLSFYRRPQTDVSSLSSRLFMATTENSSDSSSDSSASASSSSDEKSNTNNSGKTAMDRTSFDQAGKGLIDEEDQKRMEAMGDFDVNPDSSDAKMDQMRAAIRARTADLGLEKSKVSAEYIAQKQAAALNAGSARAASESSDMFGGLDLSQISSTKPESESSNSIWADQDGQVPAMFYEPEEEMTDEEMAQVDPVGQMSIAGQFVSELQKTKWPTWGSALRNLGVMLLIVALTAVMVIYWDKLLRYVYTDVWHFIPSKEELANYADRFSDLDLPEGWTDNMNEQDVASFADIAVKTTTTGGAAASGASSMGSSMPDL